MTKKKMNRRQFLGAAGCAALGTTTMFSSINSLGMINALSAPRMAIMGADGTYKAMVCILLGGGNDSFNMLVPSTNEIYDVYANTRTNLALPQGDLLNLNYTDGAGYNYGLHPSMPEVQALFNANKLAFLSNVGTLIEPTTKAQVLNDTATLPLGLLSHSDQVRHWQTSLPQSRSAQGWAGKIADILYTQNENQDVSMSISLDGTNVWQAGQVVEQFNITPYGNGSVGIEVLEGGDFLAEAVSGGVTSLLEQQYNEMFKQTYANKVLNAQSQHTQFSEAIAGVS
ncbi:MAG: DUF1501 domain-containing protein, partial [Flavobacteriales bacterium]|nr:DUF1501 domain-containing protein [Flavobacteriales bacterium]